MRILFFSHYFPPEGNAPASRTYENCRRWVNAGHEVTVITCAPNCPDGVVYDGYKNKLYSRETVDGIDVRRVWTYIAANEGTVRRIMNYVSYMVSAFVFSFRVKRPDIVIATSPQFFCGWAGVLSRFFRRTPFILEIRDLWPESIIAVGAMRESRLVRVLEYLERIMYDSAQRIVTVGDGYKRRLMEKGVAEQRISVVMNGVNRELFTPREPDEALKQQYNLAGKFVCSYSGTIGMACGLEIVLDAAQKLKERGVGDIAFLLVGDGASRKDLEAQAREREIDAVIFTGRQPKEMMPEFLAITDVCLVHLRKTDLFTTVMPSKIFEAAGMAKPIVNGVGGFAADFIEKAGAGVNIEPENSDELIVALLQLREQSELREAYGHAGREYVLAHYDRDTLADDYLKIIDTVAMDKDGRK
ncbi:MAG: glycosyltransferase family 4 protein [FCB group bacterium]|jgi:glycosyltransferase involved in cell wall biosynthesis|nr:glycosyltransferase family 4 protein [FCB group bacterium]